MDSRIAIRALDGLAIALAGALAVVVLIAAGQPLFTDDLWWHLSLGEAYARDGLFLAQDPQLFTAPGPPSTSSWLSDRIFYAVWQIGGFQALRIFHVLLAGAVLVLAWRLLRRACESATVASLLWMGFMGLSAYRLVQLRPHLLTMLFALALYRLVIARDAPGGRTRVAVAVLLLLVWANAHSAFVLGPLLLAVSAAGLLISFLVDAAPASTASRSRIAVLGAALVLGSLATFVNPGGIEPHFAYFASGGETPNLLRVADEWLPVSLFGLPVPRLPPSPLAWFLVWGCIASVGLGAAHAWRERFGKAPAWGLDPALLALAVVSIAMMLTAVRFLWLGIFPLLLLAEILRARRAQDANRQPKVATALLAALAAAAILAAFVRVGDWPMISRAISADRYAQAYPTGKYFAHAVWMLRDAGVRGTLYNDYTLGGFIGYWLAPGLQVFVNGSLNVPPAVMEANRAIRAHRGLLPGQDLSALLDSYGIDVYFGIRLPIDRPGSKAFFFTTTDLEGARGWIPIFRNLDSAVYLRATERNRANLERVSAWYESEGVPFDSEIGFDAERVIRAAPVWAMRRGLIPVDFAPLGRESGAASPTRRLAAQERLAALYAALGLYEDALRMDRRTLQLDPDNQSARRRRVWSLLHLGRDIDAVREAEELRDDPAHSQAARLKQAVAELGSVEDPGAAVSLRSRLPLFSEEEAAWLKTGVPPAEVRAR